jgi:hypothetical protein
MGPDELYTIACLVAILVGAGFWVGRLQARIETLENSLEQTDRFADALEDRVTEIEGKK